MANLKKKRKVSGLLIAVGMAGFLYLVFRYQDTDLFQNTLDFLFNPGSEHALPMFWQENRMLLQAGLVILVALFYRPTWVAYRGLYQTFRESQPVSKAPNVSPVQASYFYCQDTVIIMAAWLMTMCREGAVSLHYRRGVRPWTLQYENDSGVSPVDKELLTVLFRSNSSVALDSFVGDPLSDVEQTAQTLLAHVQEKYQEFFQERQSRLAAWLLLFLFFGEIPFFQASQEGTQVGTLPVTLFSTLISAGPAYVVGKNLQKIFTGDTLVPVILFVFSLLFALFGNYLIFSGAATASYFSAAFWPNIVATLITLVTMVPLMATNTCLFRQIVGYHKYLDQESTPVNEADLPWTIGLDAKSNVFYSSFRYTESDLPKWLLNDSDKDVQELLKHLHQTFTVHLGKAVYGERKSGNTSIGGGMRMGDRY